MDGFDIKVEGLDECLRTLDKMPTDLALRAIQPALVAACVPVIETLAGKTPVRTGDLLEHLTFSVEMSKDQKGGTANIGFGAADQVARWMEYGHREVTHQPDLKEVGFYHPEPFMRPSAEESADAAVEAFADSVAATVDSGLKVA